jgi:trk system potassium uptake protein TrkA
VKVIIVGCGRVGAVLAETFDAGGHEVVILDTSTSAFDRLHASFGGSAVRGDGTDEDVLRRAGAEDADLFLSMTEGDNRNVMAAQVAVESLGARRVLAKINDPVRAAAYASLGIATVCRTVLLADAILGFVGERQSGMPVVAAPTGSHHGADHPPHDRPGSRQGAHAAPGEAGGAPGGGHAGVPAGTSGEEA